MDGFELGVYQPRLDDWGMTRSVQVGDQIPHQPGHAFSGRWHELGVQRMVVGPPDPVLDSPEPMMAGLIRDQRRVQLHYVVDGDR